MNIVYMGTPDFSVTILDYLIRAGHHISTVITQPDRPKGRGKKLQSPPVAIYAKEYSIPVIQPQSLNTDEIFDFFQIQQPDIVVVAAYGRIIPAKILSIPKFGFINVHASLLPYYRGAAPIQWAIRNGDKKTGVSIMKVEEGLDEGPVYAMQSLLIDNSWNKKDLFDELALLGGKLLVQTLEQIEKKIARPVKQEHEKATYAPMFKKNDAKINFEKKAMNLVNLNRSLLPDEAIYTFINGKRFSFRKTTSSNKEVVYPCPVGSIVEINKESISIKTGQGILIVYEIQPAGKKSMSIKEFQNGYSLKIGDIFQSIE